jgi:hypothetical protein
MLRVKVLRAPGYEDRWHASLITYLRSSDGRSIAVLEADDKSWHVIESQYIREPRTPDSPYDACGCIAPCPDHKSPAQDAERDRAYWDDRYAEQVQEVDQEQD